MRITRTRTVALLMGLIFHQAEADLATVYLKDGRAITVELAGVDPGQLRWTPTTGSSEVQTFFRNEIKSVDFPTTPSWRAAESAFESGRLNEADKLYEEVIADPVSNYHPIPGNFVSLSKLRLLELRRLEMEPKAIGKAFSRLRSDFLGLAPELRVEDPVVLAWIAASKEQWEKVLSLLEPVSVRDPETSYLRGRALEETGKGELAIQEYAGAYVMNFGGFERVSRESLQRSAKLLEELNDRDRIPELAAQVKLYRDLFGEGKLWEGASGKLAALADQEIETIGEAEGENSKPDSERMTDDGPVLERSGNLATLPPLAERDYIVPGEISERIFTVGKGSDALEVALRGGVTSGDAGYVFDGTGGGIAVAPVDLSNQSPVFLLRIQFVPEVGDAVVAEHHTANGEGFELSLKKEELHFVWKASKEKLTSWKIGDAPVGKLAEVLVHAWKQGTVVLRIGDEEQMFDKAVAGGGLKLGAAASLRLGDVRTIEDEAKSITGESLPPFKGVIRHFSVATGDHYEQIREAEIARFGKFVSVRPPLHQEEGEEKKESAEGE